jgi:hypothetical protein
MARGNSRKLENAMTEVGKLMGIKYVPDIKRITFPFGYDSLKYLSYSDEEVPLEHFIIALVNYLHIWHPQPKQLEFKTIQITHE